MNAPDVQRSFARGRGGEGTQIRQAVAQVVLERSIVRSCIFAHPQRVNLEVGICRRLSSRLEDLTALSHASSASSSSISSSESSTSDRTMGSRSPSTSNSILISSPWTFLNEPVIRCCHCSRVISCSGSSISHSSSRTHSTPVAVIMIFSTLGNLFRIGLPS
jgi:hypothetical protein